MSSIIVLLLILIIGFISTNLIFHRLHTNIYAPSGIEYIFLGIIIGPAFSDFINKSFNTQIPHLINSEMLNQLSPGISAAIGIIGFIYGLRFKFSSIQKAIPEHIRLAFFELITGFVLLGGAAFGIFYYFFFDGTNIFEIIAASYAAGIMGSLSSNYVIDSLIKKYNITGSFAKSIHQASLLNLNISILLYGLLFGIIHIGAEKGIFITPTEWVVISVMLALTIGFLFFIFVGREEDENKLFVAVLGITIFTSGAAYYINFSPLCMNLILGIILGNFSKVTSKIENALGRLLHPLSMLVVVMTGYFWMPASFGVSAAAIIIFIILRYFSKYAGGYIAYKSAYNKSMFDQNIGKGLLPIDIIVCAMVVDYILVYQNQFTPIVVTAVLTAAIFFNLFSYSSTKNYLIDSGEITGENL
ncbi:MAG: hypothetical protein AUK34_11115 [Ignavibacteria bacterium CG2_30_36_16]|nr:hypothetical protein [Ignavibacteria bacterium]OIP56628.1 MAG: hypothetical protein AUK34_11115 [Ignavibacteria bacterium CG2_30_36_16]PJA99565.1 MAG: hypothetical protein CO127_10230 [Ignavibacteria bacterium CG_4_9_14_3_um_filter_36_18]